MYEREPCPRCTNLTGIRHCSSPYCGWFACNKCTSTRYLYVVFNRAKNWYLTKLGSSAL